MATGRYHPVVLLVIFALVLGFTAGSSGKVFFFESFEESLEGRWIQSEDSSYEGKFKREKSEESEDYGLFIPEKAKKYGIVAMLAEPADPSAHTTVLQYEVRMRKGMECGGAYLKFLMPQGEGWRPEQFKDSTPYSVMFGPDKCGATNKVHFIFRHKSPTKGEHVEHHLAKPPVPRAEWVSHVYTAIVYPSNSSLRLLVDGEEKSSAQLLSYSDFQPPVLLPATIPDPDDKKPEDWDERPKVEDPNAKKPDDWDESAPREIPDEDAAKPEGWLDDEPLEVDDPEASRPSDWDEEEDGEWEPPKAPNPKCQEAPGCGEWKRPSKPNPAYKGKWRRPMIENPAYKGKWKPRDIANPDYVPLEKPQLEPIAGVGIEIWTMTDEIFFDNILITDSVELAEEYRESKWQPKFEKEEAVQKEKEKKAAEEKKVKEPKPSIHDRIFEQVHKLVGHKLLKPYEKHLLPLVLKAEERPFLAYAAVVGTAMLPLALLLLCLGGGTRGSGPTPSSVPVEQAKKEDISGPDDSAKAEAEGNSASAAAAGPSGSSSEIREAEDEGEKVRRRTRRDT